MCGLFIKTLLEMYKDLVTTILRKWKNFAAGFMEHLLWVPKPT